MPSIEPLNERQKAILKQTLYKQNMTDYFNSNPENPPEKCGFCEKVITRSSVANDPYIYHTSFALQDVQYICESCMIKLSDKHNWKNIEDDDWRLTGQEINLFGVNLIYEDVAAFYTEKKK